MCNICKHFNIKLVLSLDGVEILHCDSGGNFVVKDDPHTFWRYSSFLFCYL